MAEYGQKAPDSRPVVVPAPHAVARSAAPSIEGPSPDSRLAGLSSALNRSPQVRALTQLQEEADRSPQVMQLAALAASLQGRPGPFAAARLDAASDRSDAV